MFSRNWWRIEANVWKVCATLFGLTMLGISVATRRFVDQGWPHPTVIAGLASLLFAYGVHRCWEWSRWVGYATVMFSALLTLSHIRGEGWTTENVVLLVGALALGWQLHVLPITRIQRFMRVVKPAEFQKMLQEAHRQTQMTMLQWGANSLVLLYRNEPLKSLDSLARAASSAFGHPFELVRESMADPTEAALLPLGRQKPAVAGIEAPYVCFEPPYLISIHKLPGAHPGAASVAREARQKIALQETRWSLVLELLPSQTVTQPPDDGYHWTGKLAAALMGDACWGTLFLDDGVLRLRSPELIDALRSDHPLVAASNC